jgi:miniconductance mechanosensitive channel
MELSESFHQIFASADPVFLFVLITLAVLSFILVRFVLIFIIYRALERTETTWDDILRKKGVFRQLAYLAPAIVLYYGVAHYTAITAISQQFILIYIVINVVIIQDRLLSAGLEIYRLYPISDRRPIKAYIQLAKLIIYILGAVTCVALLLGKSPLGLLGGIGALMAVLILVFRDTILSLIASIQLAANDLLHRGDWIELPQFGADGEVIDIALHAVTVHNWDKTIVTVPSYKLMEDSFKNWRGMLETGGRRIKRSLLIDQTSVRICDGKMLKKYEQIDRLKPYLKTKLLEVGRNDTNSDPTDDSVYLNSRMLTNLGTFRAYALAYIKENPNLSDDLTVMVRQLQPTPDGLPLEIYVFSKETDALKYEAIQSDIFDHLLAALPYFDLRVFQHPTGQNFEMLKGQAQSNTVT